jgi:hypothetical protein
MGRNGAPNQTGERFTSKDAAICLMLAVLFASICWGLAQSYRRDVLGVYEAEGVQNQMREQTQ